LALAALGNGARFVLSRLAAEGQVVQASAVAVPAGIRMEDLKADEELFGLAGMKAIAVKHSGGDVDFWLEFESRGRKTTEGKAGSKQAGSGALPASNSGVEGYFLLVRIPDDSTGKESWRIANRRDVVASSGVSIPVAGVNASQSQDERVSRVANFTSPIQFWDDPAGEKAESTVNSIRSTLPPDLEVCLAVISGRQKKEGIFTEVFKARVMCKAVATNADTAVK
jgi:hypothetical protein